MFYLLKRQKPNECNLGDRLMVLSDYSGVPAGTRGTVTGVYEKGVVVDWDGNNLLDDMHTEPGTRCDQFAESEMEYLAFETEKHPRIDSTVNTAELNR